MKNLNYFNIYERLGSQVLKIEIIGKYTRNENENRIEYMIIKNNEICEIHNIVELLIEYYNENGCYINSVELIREYGNRKQIYDFNFLLEN